ncbi:MAG TPA: hypothetical protein VMZ26_18240, partial [Pyrinomonadaceae bacterium]|nr:hypothetical protein [Pyrinomonadaceae bacterium]
SVVVAGAALCGAYLYNPVFFAGEAKAPEAVPVAPAIEMNSVPTAANANVDGPAEAESAAPAESNAAIAKTQEPAKTVRAQDGASKPRQPKADQIIIDGETVYMGNTKITEDRIETPDAVIDENGITPRQPKTPKVRPEIPPIDMRYMTPAQRQRLLQTLRRNGVRMMPSPAPKN